MDEAKKKRTSMARKVTRKCNEVYTAMNGEVNVMEIQEKMGNLKICMEELGTAHDDYVEQFNPDEDGISDQIQKEEQWYIDYDEKTNETIRQARKYIEDANAAKADTVNLKQVRLKKIEVPVFSGNAKEYYKWKNVYERYMKHHDDETKYDYLLTSTLGEARKYVENKATYDEAITRLDEKYGNIHVIMGILINEVKSIQIVRRNDFRAFEQLSLKVDEFYDRLTLMGKTNDVENSYVLKEIESKLCYEDMQRWLESLGNQVDERRVQDLMKWLEHQTHLRRITYSNQGTSANQGTSTNRAPFQRNLFQRTSGSTSVEMCQNCSTTDHGLHECPEYLRLSNDERWERVKQFRCCFICLKSGHRRTECSEAVCSVCSRSHHLTLHKFVTNGNNFLQQVTTSPVSREQTNQLNLSRSFLPVLRVCAFTKQKSRECVIALDSFSEINIISLRCANQLGLSGSPINLKITGAGGVETVMETKLVTVCVIDKSGEVHEIECVVLPKACGRTLKLDSRLIGDSEMKEIKEKKIYTNGGEVDILIGMPNPVLHMQISLQPFVNGLFILETRFGYSLVGANPTNRVTCEEYNVNSINVIPENPDEILWRNHLQAELAGITPMEKVRTEEEKKIDQRLKISKVERDGSSRLQVSLAWKVNPEQFENNRKQAIECDHKLRKQLRRDSIIEKLFDDQFKEMIEMEVLRKVHKDLPKRYLPILAVIDLESDSTQVRFCLDAKRKFNGISFNEFLLKGKLEMNDIFQVLTGFRSGYVAIQGDIKKMFWQIMLSEYDQQFHGIIYKEETFVFTRVCFGDKPSPTIADICMHKIAREGKEDYPLGSVVVEKKRFVDDLLDSGIESPKMIQKQNETSALLGKYGFNIKEWMSNRDEVGKVKENGKVLGVLWDGRKDVLSTKIKSVTSLSNFTKRSVLKKIAEIWDPLGMLSGVVAGGKLIFQSIVRMKVKWDEKVEDSELANKWHQWLSELGKCDGFCIPRCILPSKGDIKDMKFEVCGCGDGSSVACGGAVYLRWYDKDESNVELKFLGAKGKLNPIKGTTVPRSELCGALLTSKLVHTVESALKNTDVNEYYDGKRLFSDSTTVLSWVKSASIKYKPFVKNKVMECQELHPIQSWNFIPGRDNTSADLISKGCRFKDLEKIVHGPKMLYLPREKWPSSPNDRNEEDIDSEKCAGMNISATTVEADFIDINRFQSWKKLVRVTAYVNKFIRQMSERQSIGIIKNNGDISPDLNEQEIIEAETYWIRRAQRNVDFSLKKYQQLSPFRDEDGIIRIYGRLKNIKVFDENRKHPILLPNNNAINRLIIQQAHEECVHPGHLRVMAEVRKRFWIIGLRSIAKSIGMKCTICRRWRGSALEQRMANLPSFRLNASCPFENTAIDYFGPFSMRYGYRSRTKAYGVVFTCLTTRSVQVELATDMSTDTFLLALRRFISLYGSPKFVRSDNGSNFVGAANELREMIKSWKSDTNERKKLVNICNSHGIKWTFSTPLASHHNGAVESMVKSVKTSLNKLLKNQVYKEEEYRTIFAQVTSIINSRPLWPVSDGDLDQSPITCNDILRPRGLPRDPVELNTSMNPRKRYDHIQNVCNDWWRIWLLHFVPNLQCRSKWYKDRCNVAEGDIVLLIDPSVKRSEWNMGVVENVYKGDDNRVRSVRVKTQSGSYDRPITKLTLLLSKEEQC